MRSRWLALAACALSACASSTRPAQDDDQRSHPAEQRQGKPPANNPEPGNTKEHAVSPVQFKFVGRYRERPPLSTLELDVSLRNHADRARWFLLPAAVGKGQRPMDSSVFGVTVLAFPGTGKVDVARFAGAPGFYALHLPAGAEVEIRALQLRATGDLPANPLPLEIITADTLTIGGQTPAAWTKVGQTSDPRVDVTQKGATRVLEYTTPDLKDVPVELQGAERFTETVPIGD
jgi:hypothetical protein